MTVQDDLKRLAAEDIVYLTHTGFIIGGQPGPSPVLPALVLRGRLRQALSGNWVFDASTGLNGVVGWILGDGTGWTSSDTPLQGLQVTAQYPSNPSPPTVYQIILSTLIPQDLTT